MYGISTIASDMNVFLIIRDDYSAIKVIDSGVSAALETVAAALAAASLVVNEQPEYVDVA